MLLLQKQERRREEGGVGGKDCERHERYYKMEEEETKREDEKEGCVSCVVELLLIFTLESELHAYFIKLVGKSLHLISSSRQTSAHLLISRASY